MSREAPLDGGALEPLPRVGRLGPPRAHTLVATFVHTAIACAICTLVLGAVFVGLMALSIVASDDARIEDHLRQAVERGVLSRNNYPFSPYGDTFHGYDMNTECVAFGLDLSNHRDSLLYRIAATPYIVDMSSGAPQPNACESLVGALESGNEGANAPYIRFWHGYAVFLRPLLTVLSLENVHRITAIALFAIMLFFAHRMAEWFGPWAWPVVLLPFFAVGDFLTMPMVVSHAVPIGWIFLSAALVTLILDRIASPFETVLPVFVFCAGAITNFLAFLLNPPLAPAIIGFLVIAHGTGHGPGRTGLAVGRAAWLVGIWFAGYAIAWIGKWVLAASILGVEPVLGEITGTANYYLTDDMVETLHLLQASWINLAGNMRRFAYIVATCAIAAVLLAYAVLSGRASRDDLVDFAAMVLPLTVVVFWVELAPVHSVAHAGFVYRSFMLFSIFPLLASLLILRRTRHAA